LLPALPDVWPSGSITGLQARGGFAIESMEWKNGRLVRAVIKSNLGGNLRLRVFDELKLVNGTVLNKANGENKNPFYKTEIIANPIISEKAIITAPVIKESFVYDIVTKAGQVVTLVVK
jgi:alpha-L-fucosidase 2